jgi:alanine-glyoxylate transaminase/(R)-3-amino-2-methylpropionate-pyruvate transaminase
MYAISAMGHASVATDCAGDARHQPDARPVLLSLSVRPVLSILRHPLRRRCQGSHRHHHHRRSPLRLSPSRSWESAALSPRRKEYFQKVLEPIRKAGALFICDEVQTGFGRTGTYWNGIEHWGVQPDIMTFAKGIASGMPMGATITTKEIASAFRGLTISTYGGNPVSSVAALATIHVMTRENIPERAARLGNRLRQGLLSLQEKYPLIGDVRGMGLMQGIELVEDRKTKEPASKRANLIIEILRKRQLLIGKGGLYGNTLRIAPPMLVTESQIDEAIAHLDAGLHQVSAS